MAPRLSILICTIESRRELLARLMAQLTPQLTDAVEVLVDCDAGQATIGSKRQRLIERASGEHLAFIDDDDAIADTYRARIIDALENGPDCVGFLSRRFLDGKQIGDCSYSLKNWRVEDEMNYNEGTRYFRRTPGHLCPIRRDLVLKTGFQPWCTGEDRDFERRIYPLLKTEVFVDAPLYDYLLVSREMRGRETVHPDRWRLGRNQSRLMARA